MANSNGHISLAASSSGKRTAPNSSNLFLFYVSIQFGVWSACLSTIYIVYSKARIQRVGTFSIPSVPSSFSLKNKPIHKQLARNHIAGSDFYPTFVCALPLPYIMCNGSLISLLCEKASCVCRILFENGVRRGISFRSVFFSFFFFGSSFFLLFLFGKNVCWCCALLSLLNGGPRSTEFRLAGARLLWMLGIWSSRRATAYPSYLSSLSVYTYTGIYT